MHYEHMDDLLPHILHMHTHCTQVQRLVLNNHHLQLNIAAVLVSITQINKVY